MESTGPPPEGDLNSGPAIIAATFVVAGVSTLVVALRLSVRIWITKSTWWDDWTILFATVGNVIGTGLDAVEVHYGFGRPDHYLTKWQLIEYRKYTYGEWIQTFATLMWTKVSICLFLMRIPVAKTLLRPLQGAVVFLLLSNVILTILWIVQCRPLDTAWNTDVEGSCFRKGQLDRIIITQALISAISDFTFSGYPVLILWKVQMKLKDKVALCCLMGVGIFTGACCIVRTVLNSQSIPADFTHGGIDNWFWRLFEVNIGIIAACTPALRPGYRWIKSKVETGYHRHGHAQLTDEVRLQPLGAAMGKSTTNVRSAREANSHPTDV